MTPQRTQKRENERGKEVLKTLINSFFSLSMKMKSPEEIRKSYKYHESQWMYYAHKQKGNPKVKSNIMMDSFESSILKSHRAILRSDRAVETKLSMLRVLRYVQGKSKFACFLRELPLWIKAVFQKYKQVKQKQYEKMINPSLNLKAR